MADAKTQITEVDPDEFLETVEPAKKQEDAYKIDALYQKVTGTKPAMWGPATLGYGSYKTTYASGRDVHWLRAGFSPRKAKHSLYLMAGYCDQKTGALRDALLAKLGKHKTGKSCLYINKLADVDIEVLEQLVRNDWEAMARLYPED